MNAVLNTRALVLAGAITGAVVIAVCFGLYAVLGRPDPWMELFVGSGPSVGGWLVGMLEGALVGALEGILIGFFYNRFAAPPQVGRP